MHSNRAPFINWELYILMQGHSTQTTSEKVNEIIPEKSLKEKKKKIDWDIKQIMTHRESELENDLGKFGLTTYLTHHHPQCVVLYFHAWMTGQILDHVVERGEKGFIFTHLDFFILKTGFKNGRRVNAEIRVYFFLSPWIKSGGKLKRLRSNLQIATLSGEISFLRRTREEIIVEMKCRRSLLV